MGGLKQKTYRSDSYLAWVRSLPSVVGGAGPCIAHHIIAQGQGGMGMKASDLLTFPLTPLEHNELHKDPRAWDRDFGPQWKWVALTLAAAIEHGGPIFHVAPPREVRESDYEPFK